jgi:sterol desaturase/sphingolipid hydroxylase (fatty acid hydroxylase superfamily)
MLDLSYLKDVAAYQALRFVNPGESFFLAYFVGGVLFALCVALWRRRRRRNIRARALARIFGTRKLWLHRSTRLDAKLYLMHGVLAVVLYGALQTSSEVWRVGVQAALTASVGPSPLLVAPAWLAGSLTTVAQVVVLELGYWAMHWAFHKIPALWELHKVHHSAEVMTPLTEWRQHPVEFFLFVEVFAACTGATYGAMTGLFGAAGQPFTLFQINLLLVLHLATFHHLRHSGVWIAATGWLGRLAHSPAHHQIHHSTDPRHFDRNFGYALSIWDWAFGTLWIPERRGKVTLGVQGEPAYSGVADTLLRPLVRLVARPGSPAPAATA